MSSEWFVYILRCADGTLYTGVTTDVTRRVEEHNASPKGAKYTRVRRPVALAHQEAFPDRSAACSREAAIKKLSRADKTDLIRSSVAHSSPPVLHEAGVQCPG